MSPRGRRPQGADTRGDILTAARAAFATDGYAATSMRGIAREAGVDPALVHHYFDGKPDLFFHAVIGDLIGGADAAIRPGRIIASVLDGPREQLAERWTRAFILLWDGLGGERLTSIVHAVTAGGEVREPVLQFLQHEVFLPIVRSLETDHSVLRAQLAAAHVLGIGIGRYVARLPLLSELSADELVALTAPNLQHYLTGDLDLGAARPE